MKLISASFSLAVFLVVAVSSQAEESITTNEIRITTPLMENWRFVQDDQLTDDAAVRSTGADWKTVNLPHTWNAHDAASTNATKPYKRGLGWYRLEFNAPQKGARKWLEFGAASMVADVWLNGQKLGQHKGGFTVFRFDITDRLKDGKNTLVVKTDNHAPTNDFDTTAIFPLAGDFNFSGGLYRYVSLVTTADPVHFDLGDLGGPGIYATTTLLSGRNATVHVRAKVKNDSKQDGNYVVRAMLVDGEGRVAKSGETNLSLKAGKVLELAQDLNVEQAHLWQGMEDPYLYKLVVELKKSGGETLDRLVENFGIRQMHFDQNKGFFLNGKPLRLNGVAVHQDFQNKGWALSNDDFDKSFALIKEIGANSIRLGHYPFSKYALDTVDRLGIVVWSEVPFGLGVTVEPPLALGTTELPCPSRPATEQIRANARQQLRELIRQQFNHAAVGMWSIGNETTFLSKDCPSAPFDNITPVLRELKAVAHEEDPGRVTTLADFTEDIKPPLQGQYIAVGGISDIWAINQYYLWYSGAVAELGTLLDVLHKRYPEQPIGVSEYGAGAALTHHTDNVYGGSPEVNNTDVPALYQPEEYAAYAHEQNYAVLVSKNYVWGSYVWNMFDFGSGIRNEGDMRGVNTKGLVTFDRTVKKDPFYFYKANWSKEPTTYIVGRRYIDRAYPVADVKVYSNADSVELSVNGKSVGSMKHDKALLNTYVFKDVHLKQGDNKLTAVGKYAGKLVSDAVDWSLNTREINIAAGQYATGFKSADGQLFGSDNFFIGGASGWLIPKNFDAVTDRTAVSGTRDAELFKNYRHGAFSYFVPLSDGNYDVTLRFIEPDRNASIGQNVFNVVANGETKLENFDILKTANVYRTVVTRTFPVKVVGGHLKLDFIPARGEAVVSNLSIQRQEMRAER